MVGIYEVVMVVVLLFPWSLVLTIVLGAAWSKVRALGRVRLAGELASHHSSSH